MTPVVCGMDAQVLSEQQNSFSSMLSVGLGWGLGRFSPGSMAVDASVRCRLLPQCSWDKRRTRGMGDGEWKSLGCQGRAAATSSAVAFSGGRTAVQACSRPASATFAHHVASDGRGVGWHHPCRSRSRPAAAQPAQTERGHGNTCAPGPSLGVFGVFIRFT